MAELPTVRVAIEASFAAPTAASPGRWSADNPASGHCDVASFVAWEHLGGDLVLGEVHRTDGTFQEHHYWNRVDGVDVDLTRDQFRCGEVITETQVLSAGYLRDNQDALKADVRERIARFREVVAAHLDGPEPQPG